MALIQAERPKRKHGKKYFKVVCPREHKDRHMASGGKEEIYLTIVDKKVLLILGQNNPSITCLRVRESLDDDDEEAFLPSSQMGHEPHVEEPRSADSSAPTSNKSTPGSLA
uniref:Uncharacterized protein n=1 Tax=Acrobeloides nanus TaxID=290746 RepID=A0A914DHU3_9BILA